MARPLGLAVLISAPLLGWGQLGSCAWLGSATLAVTNASHKRAQRLQRNKRSAMRDNINIITHSSDSINITTRSNERPKSKIEHQTRRNESTNHAKPSSDTLQIHIIKPGAGLQYRERTENLVETLGQVFGTRIRLSKAEGHRGLPGTRPPNVT